MRWSRLIPFLVAVTIGFTSSSCSQSQPHEFTRIPLNTERTPTQAQKLQITAEMSIDSGKQLDLDVIRAENIHLLEPLVRIGKGIPTRVEWSPEGNVLAVASSVGVWIYSRKGLAPMWFDDYFWDHRGLEWGSNLSAGAMFSSDGERVISWGDGSSIEIRDADTGALIQAIEVQEDTLPIISDVAISLDDKLIGAVDLSGRVYIWQMDGGELVRYQGREAGYFTGIEFGKDRELLLSLLEKGVQVVDWEKGEVLFTAGYPSERSILAIDSSRERIAIKDSSSSLRIWQVDGGMPLESVFPLPKARVLTSVQVAFSSNGNYLAIARKNVIDLWRIDNGVLFASVEGHSDDVTGISFSPDGSELASVGLDRTLRIWNLASLGQVAELSDEVNAWTFTFHPEQPLIVTGGVGSTINLIDAITARVVTRLYHDEGSFNSVSSLAFNQDGSILASSDNRRGVLWDFEERMPITRLSDDVYGNVYGFSSSLGLLITLNEVSFDNTAIQLWDSSTGDLVRTIKVQESRIKFIDISPDGYSCVSTGKDGLLMLWNLADGSLENRFASGVGSVNVAKFKPDGSLLASGGSDGIVRVWDLKDDIPVAELSGHEGPIESLDFSPDGSLLVSIDDSGTAIVWDVESSVSLKRIDVIDGKDVLFNSAGTLLGFSSMSIRGSIWLWAINPP